ncbi:glycosyltransferase [Lachnospiraceae bacterium KM106-2]|nr:glycosyltransferase [Lachnospiraceae bacterium KM106-2]
MKILSIAIPCYNSQDYMEKAIQSLLIGGQDVEILVIDDGSKDRTREIALDYERRYPGIVRAISQENGGHGAAVNTGMKNATGVYYKVLDSDDWFDQESYVKVLNQLKTFVETKQQVDMLIANYVYEKVSLDKQKVIDYCSALPEEQIFSWNDVKHFKQSQNILMHSVFYRTQLLKDCGLELPKHTFYVDNIFVYVPLKYVKTMYYMNVDLYRYFIGRDDQSVNERVMMGRIDQQLRVTRIMIDAHDLSQIEEEKLRKYMVKHLTMMMTICTVFLVKDGSEESIAKKDAIWEYLMDKDIELYKEVKKTFLGFSMNMKSKVGKKIIILGYQISQRVFGFS